MAEKTRTLYPKRIRNKEIEESIKLVMQQFQDQKVQIFADKKVKQDSQKILSIAA